MIHLLIADDHPIFLKGLKEIIESEENYKVVCQAANGRDAVAGAKSYHPEIVILDIDMPAMNGLDAAQAILADRPGTQVIVLTMHKDKHVLLRALELGICGYVLKENAVSDILLAIYAVRENNTYLSPEISDYLQKKRTDKAPLENIPSFDTLTPAEKNVLRMIAAYQSTKDIAAQLFISPKTVSNHRQNIAQKLGLSGKNALLRFAVENL